MKRNSDMLSTQFNFTLIEVGNKHFVCEVMFWSLQGDCNKGNDLSYCPLFTD